ncbi:hypothetical protein N7G274_005541 [Stereocaulon virgatum]|uniref:Chromo domain-containing protein n=1 Tax=Stereocaulon virgatum TaxID=373712 RepID=A0ABR4A766_9LECA
MAGTYDMRGSEASDNDTISLTSTVASTQAKDHVYEIEAIVAEEISDDGVTWYLVKWKEYSEDRNTWEPMEHFNSDEILKAWKERQMRVSRGRETAFDVTAWLERQIQLEQDTERRRWKRQKKRLRLDRELDSRLSLSEGDGQESPDKDISSAVQHYSPSSDLASSPPAQEETQNKPARWDDEEKRMLEKGLEKAKGPHFSEILGLYGHRGTVNCILEGRSLRDLRKKTEELRQEFIIAGREPPAYYFETLSEPLSRAKARDSSGLDDSISEDEASSDSEKAVDSFVEEIKEKVSEDQSASKPNPVPEKTTMTPEAPKDTRKETSPPSSMEGSKHPSKGLGVTNNERVAGYSRPASANRSKTPVKAPTREARSDMPEEPTKHLVQTDSSIRVAVEPSKRTSFLTQGQKVPNTARMGAAGHGPARLPSAKTSTRGINFMAEPKPRRMIPAIEAEEPAKRFTKLSIQNSVMKSRRIEPAPNRDSLILLDPKTGKTPRSAIEPSNTLERTRKPFQVLQEKLAAEKAKDRQSEAAQETRSETIASANANDLQPKDLQWAESADDALPMNEADKDPSPPSPVTVKFSQPTTARMVSDRAPKPPPVAPTASGKSTERSVKLPLQGCNERLVVSTFGAAAGSNLSLAPYDPAFALMNNPPKAQRNESMALRDQNCIMGHLRLGAASSQGVEQINVKFQGLSLEMHRLLLTIKVEPRTMNFDFTKSCRASECQTYFLGDSSEILGSGSIVPYSYTKSATERLAESMAMTLSCSLFFARNFTMIMYPAGASAWAFLDSKVPAVPQGTLLRFVVLQPLPERLASEDPIVDRLADQNIDRLDRIKAYIRENPTQPDEKSINIVFRDMFEIEYGRLTAQNGQQKYPAADVFFLCFIPQGCELYEPDSVKRMALRTRTSEEHDFFIEFLEANGAKEVYSVQDKGSIDVQSNGAWDYFINNVKSGQIVFHDACIRIDQVPNLAKFLREGAINVWKLSLSPMHPAEKHPHLVRLFPHGGVILLTESLIIYRPHEALRIIMWFRRVQLPMKPSGTWKIAARPHIRDWLLDIMDIIADTKKDIFGHGIQVIADIYTEVHLLFETTDPEDNSLMCYDFDNEIPTDDAPIVTSASLRTLQERKEWKGDSLEHTELDHDNIRQNDDLLVQWFAEWSMVNLESFRKFHAILGYSKGHDFGDKALKAYEKGWGHIEILTAEECFKRHNVTSQEELDEMEAECRRKIREQILVNKEEARKAQVEERQAAREALETTMQVFKDAGATETEILAAGRRHLKVTGATDKEIEACAINMERVLVKNYWDEPYKGPHNEKDGEDVVMNDG